MTTINYYQNLYDSNDNKVLIDMVNEQIESIGIPVILRHYIGKGVFLDPVYQDIGSYAEMDKNNLLYQNNHTYCVVEYERFNNTLQSWGMTRDEGTNLEGMMKLEDKPSPDDIVQFMSPYDDSYFSFKISSVDEHRGLCYRTQLIPYYQDVEAKTVYEINEPKRKGKVKQIDINHADDSEVIKI